MTALLYPIAAVLEIAGCFAVWSWWRGGRSFAIYRGVSIAASLGWLWLVEGCGPTASIWPGRRWP